MKTLFSAQRLRLAAVSLGSLSLLISGCGAEEAEVPEAPQSIASITLSNPSGFARVDEATYLALEDLGVESGSMTGLAVLDGDVLLPSELIDTDGDGYDDTLLFVADYDVAASRKFTLSSRSDAGVSQEKRTQAEVSVKEGGAWEDGVYKGGEFVNVEELLPPPQYTDHSEYIRYEGPGIESDRVGYRFYLDWRNGFDIFGKKTNAMVLQDVGIDGYDSYHEPADWGMDILKVGDAVGIGGYGYWDGEKVIRVSETDQRSTRVIENGDLYSSLAIDYAGWLAGEHKTDLTALLSMTAGSRTVKVRLQTSPELPNLAVGLVKHPDAELIHGDLEISGHAWSYIASWGTQALSGDELGLFILFKKGARSKQTEDEHNFVSVMNPANGQVEYYFGAVWEQEPGGIGDKGSFVEYLEQEVEKLTMPLRASLETALTISETSQSIDSAKALQWSSRLAESEITRLGDSLRLGGFDAVGNRDARWSYTTGLLAQAMDDLSSATGDPKFAQWGKATLDSYVGDDGVIQTYRPDEFNIDHVNSGKMLLRYLERTNDDKYRVAAESIRQQLRDHPRTSEGAFWHKQRYPWQLWLDGVYMGMPFLAHHATMEGDEHGFEEAFAEAKITHRRLRDPESGLYYHAWDERAEQVWADSETGLSAFFWSRGMGWYAMALVDLLDFVPDERTDIREPMVAIIRELADALLAHRVEGVWYQITDQPDATGNYLEASGSSMFVYMLAKAINKGYLDDGYRDATAESYRRLVEEFISVSADGAVSLKNVCQVAGLGYGRDGSYRYYMSEPVVNNDPKGVGPFIMAGIEISEMLKD
jgi:rhamnogalacturonyl hydrolase YesR